MIIRTSQDAALVDCCGCQPVACDEPFIHDAGSVLVYACGFAQVIHDDLTPEDACIIYKTKSVEINFSSSEDSRASLFPFEVISNNTISEDTTCVIKAVYAEGYCSEVATATTWIYAQTITYYDPAGSDVYSGESSSGPGSPCEGTFTTNGTSEEYNHCPVYSPIPDNEWESISATSFTKTTSVIEADFTSDTVQTVTFSDPYVRADLDAALAAEAWSDFGAGSSGWHWVISYLTIFEGCEQIATGQKMRYKMGIPESWMDFEGRHAAWVPLHAAWMSCMAVDPTECGPEPIEPVERSYYSAQWDEVAFPEAHRLWVIARDAHVAWTACEAETPGDCGDEPPAPGEEPPGPSLVASRSWTYDGTDEASDWFEIPAPEEAGETRLVNMLTKCHRNSGLGVKPTSHGEVYELT